MKEAVLLLAALFLALGWIGAATSCGEPLVSASDSCAEWQCSRDMNGYCVRGWDEGHECWTDGDCFHDLHCLINESLPTNTSGVCVKSGDSTKQTAVGLVSAVIGVICFGSSFVPIKKYKKFAGDGLFAQFMMNFGRFAVGVIIMATRENKWFYWDAALGGALWSVGNAMGVPIVQCIGIALGVSIWGSTNMLLGWASGHFGLWGVKKEVAKTPFLEYLGVVFSLISIVLFIFVRPVRQVLHDADKKLIDEEEARRAEEESTAKNDENRSLATIASTPHDESSKLINNAPQRVSLAETLGERQARVIGVSMALAAGVLFGVCMDPAQRMMSHYDSLTLEEDIKYSPFGLDYVFSNNIGALLASFTMLVVHTSLHFLGYRPTEKYFDPVDHHKLVLPAFAAGAIGSCGSAAWFFANQNLGLIVSFPIVAAGPGVVSSLWGALLFKEIKGVRNFAILGTAFVFVISAGVCSSMSKN
jgi:glucose uptake protein GlcU